VIPVITFTTNALIGTPTVPEIIHALNIYSNTNALAKGWNWISFNLSASKLADLDSMFADLTLEEGDLIKGPDKNNAIVFDTYDSGDGKWQGTLSNSGGLNVTSMYMLKLALKQDLLFSGKPVVTGDVPVTLTTGWNWIGYTPQENMTVKEAFGYHLPVADDQVKSQYGFSIYDDLMGWIGSLEYLKPGRGYMYYSHQAGSFYYPEKSSLKSSFNLENETLIPAFAYQWPDNMTIVAKIVPTEKVNEDYVVYAYQNNTLTGAGITDFNENTGEWLWFIQVFGDTRQEKVSFIVENPSGTEKLMVNEEFLFQADDMIGTLANPVVLTLGNEQLNIRGINVYPNPFSDALFISAETREFTRIELIDTEGRILRNYSYKPDKRPFTEKLDLPEGLKEGIYILKILGTQDTHYIKIVKQ
jgi:hypothetical protein